MEIFHQNPQTFPIKNPENAQRFDHGFAAQSGAYRHAVGRIGSGRVEEQILAPIVDFARISSSAAGVVRNVSISTITYSQSGSTPHPTDFLRQGQRKL